MGAWGSGPFENDDAMDFVGDLADGAGPLDASLMTALDLPETGYLQMDDATIAIAAAALVGASRSGVDPKDPTVRDLLRSRPVTGDPALTALAVRALDRVVAEDSEWLELWTESDAEGAATAELDRIRATLQPG